MSTTDTTRTDDPGLDSVWGAPPPAAVPPAETYRPAPARRWLPDMVKTKVAALLAAAGLVVGGAAGVAVGHSTGGTQTPAGQNGQVLPGQGGPGGQGGFGGPPGTTQQGQSGTTQQGQSGTTQQGQSGAQGTVPGTTT